MKRTREFTFKSVSIEFVNRRFVAWKFFGNRIRSNAIPDKFRRQGGSGRRAQRRQIET